MTNKYVIGNLRTGRRIQTLPDVIEGPWDDALNAAGAVSVTVPLNDPDIKKLGLKESAAPGNSFLAVFDDDTGLQGGPIWSHVLDDDNNTLTIIAGGMWSYFDHRVLLPVLAGRLPTDSTTDTRWQNISVDPDFPWGSDTSKSYQGMVRGLVAQAQLETGGNVPVILPTEIAGENDKWWKGSDVGSVGDRLFELSQLQNGPDIRFVPRYTTDRLGVEWFLQIGTPTQPMISGLIRPVFNVSVVDSSVSGLRANVDGKKIASRAFAVGGRSIDQATITVSSDSTLTTAGFPLLEMVDSTHSTVSETAALQGYSDALVTKGRKPTVSLSFDHDLAQSPFLSSFNVGDFATIKFKDHGYFGTADLSFRIIRRSGESDGRKVSLIFQPEVI